MINKKLRSGLSIGLVLAVFQFTNPLYAATDSLGLTVVTTVEMGPATQSCSMIAINPYLLWNLVRCLYF